MDITNQSHLKDLLGLMNSPNTKRQPATALVIRSEVVCIVQLLELQAGSSGYLAANNRYSKVVALLTAREWGGTNTVAPAQQTKAPWTQSQGLMHQYVRVPSKRITKHHRISFPDCHRQLQIATGLTPLSKRH